MRANDHGQCLTEETLTEYLEGSLDPALKAVSEVHLVACDGCRTQLGYFMHLLGTEVRAEEESALQTIAAKWQDHRNRLPPSTGTFPAWFLASAGVAAVLLIAIVVGYFMEQRSEPKSASDIVQLLLANQRPFESRMSNEPHVPLVRTRGAEDPGVDYGLLAGQMTELSAGVHEMGRFYLLQKDFELATQYLEIAEREISASAAVHNDLGVAYLEAGDPAKVSKAGQEFRHALASRSHVCSGNFQSGIVLRTYKRRRKRGAEWKHYLEVDPKSDWSKEVRDTAQKFKSLNYV